MRNKPFLLLYVLAHFVAGAYVLNFYLFEREYWGQVVKKEEVRTRVKSGARIDYQHHYYLHLRQADRQTVRIDAPRKLYYQAGLHSTRHIVFEQPLNRVESFWYHLCTKFLACGFLQPFFLTLFVKQR